VTAACHCSGSWRSCRMRDKVLLSEFVHCRSRWPARSSVKTHRRCGLPMEADRGVRSRDAAVEEPGTGRTCTGASGRHSHSPKCSRLHEGTACAIVQGLAWARPKLVKRIHSSVRTRSSVRKRTRTRDRPRPVIELRRAARNIKDKLSQVVLRPTLPLRRSADAGP